MRCFKMLTGFFISFPETLRLGMELKFRIVFSRMSSTLKEELFFDIVERGA